jgi:hypothetical protein
VYTGAGARLTALRADTSLPNDSPVCGSDTVSMPKVFAPLAAAALLSLTSACTTTDVPPADPHLGGQWQLDPAASDDADAKIAAAIADAESKLRKRLVSAGFSQYGNAGGHSGRGGHGGTAGTGTDAGGGDNSGPSVELNGDEFSATGYIGPDFGGLQRELQLALEAPRQLTIEIQPDTARIASDRSPARDYPYGDTFTRIDEYGTARMDSDWSGQTLVIRSRYSSHAVLIEQYLADARSGTLTLTRNLTDPVAGKLSVRSVYRK